MQTPSLRRFTSGIRPPEQRRPKKRAIQPRSEEKTEMNEDNQKLNGLRTLTFSFGCCSVSLLRGFLSPTTLSGWRCGLRLWYTIFLLRTIHAPLDRFLLQLLKISWPSWAILIFLVCSRSHLQLIRARDASGAFVFYLNMKHNRRDQLTRPTRNPAVPQYEAKRQM